MPAYMTDNSMSVREILYACIVDIGPHPSHIDFRSSTTAIFFAC